MALKIEGTVECDGKTYEAIDYRQAGIDDLRLERGRVCCGAAHGECIIVREVKPPAPKYRPFASAEEFKPHRDRWIRNANGTVGRIHLYDDTGVTANRFETFEKLCSYVFDDDGTPCGVLVTE